MRLLTYVKNKVTDVLDVNNDKCYKHNGKNGGCNGMLGGDLTTEFLNYGCIDCKYLMHQNFKGYH